MKVSNIEFLLKRTIVNFRNDQIFIDWNKYRSNRLYKAEIDRITKYYVYIYTDPTINCIFGGKVSDGTKIMINGLPFYVGKGKRDRATVHLQPHKYKNTPFYDKLRSVCRKGDFKSNNLVRIVKFFENEEDAYKYETLLITEIGSNFIESVKDGPLMNMNLENHSINRENTPKGEGHSNSKLTEEEVYNILLRLTNHEKILDILKDFPNLNKNTLKDIKSGKTWKVIYERFLSENPNKTFVFKGSKFDRESQFLIIKDIQAGMINKEIYDKWNINACTLYRIKNKKTFKVAWETYFNRLII